MSTTTGRSRADEDHESFDVRRTCLQVGFEQLLREEVRGFLTYSFDIERLADVVSGAELGVLDCGQHNIASLLGTVHHDTQDRSVDPRRISLQRLSFEVADLVFESEVSYFKIISTKQWFFPLIWETVGAVSLQGGNAETFGSTEEVPISRRFFLGGSTTMRGV